MVRWCTWWIIRDFDLAGILCPARNSTTCDRPWCATRAMLSGARTCLTCLTLCSPPAAYLQPSPTSHSASLMPSILCRSSAPLSSAVLPIRYAPIRFRFEQVCSCERSNLMTIL